MMIGLKKQIQENDINNLYLFYGEEEYLKKLYSERIKDKLIQPDAEMMNYDVVENSNLTSTYIIESSDTLPFMSDKRLIIIKNSNFFIQGKPNEADEISSYISDIPESTVLIFIEEKVDRRNKLFKTFKKHGYIVEFNHLSEKDLVKWIGSVVKKSKKLMDYNTAIHILHTVGLDMEKINGEIEKLITYKMDSDKITISDVDAVCTKSVEAKIFDMLDAVGEKKPEKAIKIFLSLQIMNEPEVRILFMIERQFRMLYKVKILQAQGYNPAMISKKIGIQSFIVKKCINQCRFFSVTSLQEALHECLEMDVGIKTGKIAGRLAIELLLIKYSK